MSEHENRSPGDERLRVLIVGGGVAGLEAAFALRELAGDRITLSILAPTEEFVYRPMAIAEPFTSGHAQHFSLPSLAAAADAELVRSELTEVDPQRRLARTAEGASLPYDALLVCPGATMHQLYEHTTGFDDAHMDDLLHGLVQDVEQGYVKRLAIVIPAPMPWPLPGYELALMASERAWDMGAEMDITVLTPETSPLEIFGTKASHDLYQLLSERRIEVVTSAYCEVPKAQTIVVHPGGKSLKADRIVTLPSLSGPHIIGLPQDGSGFIPIDEFGHVGGLDSVWAAGDATDYPVKQGGVAAQLADVCALSIAAAAGADLEPQPFAPTLEGVLLTGGTPRYLRARSASGTSALTAPEPGEQRTKIAARYLSPHLTEPVR